MRETDYARVCVVYEGTNEVEEAVACNTNRHKCVGNVCVTFKKQTINPEAVHPRETLLYSGSLIILHYQHPVV